MVSRNDGTQTTKAKIEGIGIVFTIQLPNFLRPLKEWLGCLIPRVVMTFQVILLYTMPPFQNFQDLRKQFSECHPKFWLNDTRIMIVILFYCFADCRKAKHRFRPGACIIKLIMAVINSVTQKASVFVKANKNGWQYQRHQLIALRN